MRFEIKTEENNGWAVKHAQKQLVNTPALKNLVTGKSIILLNTLENHWSPTFKFA